MTYFNLNRQLVLWTEASFNEGITAAQFQKRAAGTATSAFYQQESNGNQKVLQ